MAVRAEHSRVIGGHFCAARSLVSNTDSSQQSDHACRSPYMWHSIHTTDRTIVPVQIGQTFGDASVGLGQIYSDNSHDL